MVYSSVRTFTGSGEVQCVSIWGGGKCLARESTQQLKSLPRSLWNRTRQDELAEDESLLKKGTAYAKNSAYLTLGKVRAVGRGSREGHMADRCACARQQQC